MDILDSTWLNCPYCGESLEVAVDYSAGDQYAALHYMLPPYRTAATGLGRPVAFAGPSG